MRYKLKNVHPEKGKKKDQKKPPKTNKFSLTEKRKSAVLVKCQPRAAITSLCLTSVPTLTLLPSCQFDAVSFLPLVSLSHSHTLLLE